MNVGVVGCIAMGVIFSVLLVMFVILKEKGAMLVSGFNMLPKEERKNYDTERMCADQVKAFLTWSIVFFIGALLSYMISQYVAIIAWGIWLILFFKDVHMDTEKAFGKYRKG